MTTLILSGFSTESSVGLNRSDQDYSDVQLDPDGNYYVEHYVEGNNGEVFTSIRFNLPNLIDLLHGARPEHLGQILVEALKYEQVWAVNTDSAYLNNLRYAEAKEFGTPVLEVFNNLPYGANRTT